MHVFEVGNLYHVGIAVYNATKTAKLYEKTLGLEIAHDETSSDQGIRAIMLLPKDIKSTAIELLEPIVQDSSISKFLKKKGEGIHHVCYLVDDIRLGIKRLESMGIEMIDHEPREGINNTIVAFAHPKDMNSVLIELAQKI